ncbi:alpha/beta hydrolase family protein [Alicyclobacillus fodiniaquatilis]|uniref:Alpha/beta hydrolase family protein n=1 Tax=Alicyclobacillus fodiniaquatilis TaxID=1661150 RepID=A0ABW4JPD4_9BACL
MPSTARLSDLTRPSNGLISWENRRHPPIFRACIKHFYTYYGNHLAAAAYTARSPIDHISTIHAPVLLLQGTDDHRVIWQSVQAYAEDMKKDHKTVKFVLVKGGQHGLVDHANTYGEGVSFPDTWFQKYGFPEPLF